MIGSVVSDVANVLHLALVTVPDPLHLLNAIFLDSVHLLSVILAQPLELLAFVRFNVVHHLVDLLRSGCRSHAEAQAPPRTAAPKYFSTITNQHSIKVAKIKKKKLIV